MFKIPDIQDALNQAVAKYGANEYVQDVEYLPNDAPVPAKASHVFTISTADGSDKIQVAFTPQGIYGMLLTMLLKMR